MSDRKQLDRPVEQVIELANNALNDWRNREDSKIEFDAGSRAWKKREPLLAHAILEMLKQTKTWSNLGEIRAADAREKRAIRELVDERNATRDAKFERDRAIIAWRQTFDVVCKLVAEYVDPERMDEYMKAAIAGCKPEDDNDPDVY